MELDNPMTSRRAVIAAAGALTVAGLAGCEAYGGSDPAPTTPDAGAAAGAAAAPLAATADIPVGGGKIFADKKIVVTQPQAGTFKAFSAICTHAGCPVAEVKGGTINCTCHGSKFKIADGSVASGPASSPLAAVSVKVEGASITLG